jgi:hypothetical protein
VIDKILNLLGKQKTPYQKTKQQIVKRLKHYSPKEVKVWAAEKIKDDEFQEVHVHTILHALFEDISIKKIKKYIKNRNNPKPTIEDFTNLGITTVVPINLDDINEQLLVLDPRDVDMVLLKNVADEVNSKINYLIITVDTEANHHRQSEDHVNRLIGGKFGAQSAGIFDMMDAADEVGAKITFYLDVLEEYRYKGEISTIAKEIYSRGHDLQLHAHPEIIPDDEWSKIMQKNWRQDWWSLEEADRMFTVMLDFFDENGLPRPMAFRGGSYRYNSNTIKILHEKDIKVSSNYNAFIAPERQPETWGYVAPFFWDNGVLELPITYAASTCEKRVVGTDRIDERYYERHEDPWGRMRNSAECHDHPRINTMILHSWSFLYKEEPLDGFKHHYMGYKDEKRKEAFSAFLHSKPKDFRIISVSELYGLVEKGIVKIPQEEKIERTEKKKVIGEKVIEKSFEVQKKDGSIKNYNIADNFRFEKHLWFFNKINTIKNISFLDNRVNIELNEKKDVFYMSLGDIEINRFANKEFYRASRGENHISFNLNRKNEVNMNLFIQFFNDTEKVFSKSYILKDGLNTITVEPKQDELYLRLLFRVESESENTIELSDLKVKSAKEEDETVWDPDKDFDKSKLGNTIKQYIKTLKTIDKKYYLLSPSNYSNSYSFRPRKDNETFQIDLPLNWDIDPFDEDNWRYHFHALRLLDSEIDMYISNREEEKLQRIIEVILDWKRDIVDEKKNFQFNKKEDDSFAWHDMATGLRAMKLAWTFEEIVKLEDTHAMKKYENDLYKLVQLHIEALNRQKIAPSNHAIYQIHGLMIMLRLFPNSMEKMNNIRLQTEENMLKVFYDQFFKEGIHKENSDRYHFFAVETFEKILSEEIYPDIKEVFPVMKLAKENCKYMHFPNFEPLMIGDSDYKIVKTSNKKGIKDGITCFKESGYTYVYQNGNTPSMLFFDTAFLNRTHRHADFFNVLLYEYGKNILVDAGKYSYDKNNPFRKYCTGSRAHNIVLIDDEDYKLDRKYFFTSSLILQEEKKNYYHLVTSHDYKYFKTSHERHLFYKPQEYLFVVDLLRSEKERNLKQLFHLHQDLDINEENGFFKSAIDSKIIMYIKMKTMDVDKNKNKTDVIFTKGLEGDIEGYRALEHNEIVENSILVNEAESSYVVMGSMFSFGKERDFTLLSDEEHGVTVAFEEHNEVIGEERWRKVDHAD